MPSRGLPMPKARLLLEGAMPKPLEEEEEDEVVAEDEASSDGEDEGEAPAGEEVESSLDELLAKRVERPAEEEEDLMIDLTPEERVESLTVRAAPLQPNEFVCSSCHLVKHKSQLADGKRKLCRDCV